MAKQPKETSKSIQERIVAFTRLLELDPANEVKKQTLNSLQKRYEQVLTEEMISKGMKFYEMGCKAGGDWWELIKTQYPILEVDGKFVVKSIIRDWTEERVWEFDNKYLAYAKIEQLIAWVAAERKRGYGDMENDVERFSKECCA